ncbi:MAG: hypothetical protein WBL79_11605 [Bacillota bacterium]
MLHLGVGSHRNLRALAVAIPMVLACAAVSFSAGGEREYANREHGFVFRYPDDWERQSGSVGSYPIIAFGELRKTGFAASVNVVAATQPGASAKVYARNAAARISQGGDPRLSDFREDGPGVPGAVYGGDSWLTRFSCYSSDVRNRVWFYQLTVVRGSDVIVLTAACLESEKAAYLPVFERIVSSFRLI